MEAFVGFEFPDDKGDDLGEFYESWLLIQTDNPKQLSKSFEGEEFDLYGEKHGRDFIFMGKSKKYKEDEIRNWSKRERKKYTQTKPQFQLEQINSIYGGLILMPSGATIME
jgi:hypothetical protein